MTLHCHHASCNRSPWRVHCHHASRNRSPWCYIAIMHHVIDHHGVTLPSCMTKCVTNVERRHRFVDNQLVSSVLGWTLSSENYELFLIIQVNFVLDYWCVVNKTYDLFLGRAISTHLCRSMYRHIFHGWCNGKQLQLIILIVSNLFIFITEYFIDSLTDLNHSHTHCVVSQVQKCWG